VDDSSLLVAPGRDAGLLVVGERGRLAGGAGEDESVRAVRDETAHEGGHGILVHALARVERGDHRGDDGSE